MVQQQQQQNLIAHMQTMNQMTAGGKKARELYVGNLAIGLVNEQVLRNFFNTAMLGLCPDEAGAPAVVSVWVAPDMKYSFVEMRTQELATAGLSLDKMELCGRSLNVGRPSGYVAPSGPEIVPTANPHAQLLAMQAGMQAAGMGGIGIPEAPPSKALALENMLTAEDAGGDEYDDIVEDIKEECGKHGTVLKVDIPKPRLNGATDVPGLGKAFVKFSAVEGAVAAKNALNGRTFDGRKVVVRFIDEVSFDAGIFT